MNIGKTKAKYLKYAIFILLLCFAVGVISACLPFNISVPSTLEESAIDKTAFTITTNASDGLGEFKDGYAYAYTDRALAENYRAGDPNTVTDIAIQKVASTGVRGAKNNPYVIASVEDWDRFAKNLDDGTIPDYGSGKYFVLANDIDFDGKTFHPVRFFNGTFYGLGKKLKNVSANGTAGWVYWNGSAYAQIPTSGAGCPFGYGTFCKTTNAVITDLIIENFDFRQMPSTAAFSSNRGATDTGGLVGRSYGNDTFLNCHTVGVIYTDVTSSKHNGYSGLIGAHSATSSPVFVYRCSSDSNITAKQPTSLNAHIGGILGDCFSGGNLYVYDCAANLETTVLAAANTASSAAIGCTEYQTVYLENFVGTVKVISTLRCGSGALIGYYSAGTVTLGALKNSYVAGTHGATGTENAVQPVAGSATAVTVNNTTISNINALEESGKSYPTYTAGSKLTGYNKYTVLSSLTNDAKTFFDASPYSKIWDTSKIGGSYDPDNSPVRNYLIVNVRYYNRTLSGGVENLTPLCYTADNGGEYQEVIAGNALDTIPEAEWSANHKFIGWSTLKDSWEDPLTEAVGIFGEVDLYAVWEYTGDTKQSISVTNATVDPSNSNLYTRVYEKNQRVRLESSININNMNSPTLEYQWYKKTSATETEKVAGTSENYILQDVRDSGTYRLEFTYYSAVEPLWHGVKTIDAPEVQITPAPLYLESLTTEETAYVGMDYRDIKPIAKMYALVGG
ncbi:MAG: hypothetical protein K2K85_02855, partial [Clostridia bacterium]|nr:hypothetical protein [Clostridia bacterium]